MGTMLIVSAEKNGGGTTLQATEIPLGGVDLAARKIPLIHEIEFAMDLTDIDDDGTFQYNKMAISKSDDPTSITLNDDDILAVFMPQYMEINAGATFTFEGGFRRSFAEPVAVSTSSLWLLTLQSQGTIETNFQARIFYEVKTVSSNLMVALLAS